MEQGPVSITDKASDRKISWRLGAARLVVWIIASLWNLTGARQHCCRCACQMSEWWDYSTHKPRGLETLRDVTIKRLIGYWNGAQVTRLYLSKQTMTSNASLCHQWSVSPRIRVYVYYVQNRQYLLDGNNWRLQSVHRFGLIIIDSRCISINLSVDDLSKI